MKRMSRILAIAMIFGVCAIAVVVLWPPPRHVVTSVLNRYLSTGDSTTPDSVDAIYVFGGPVPSTWRHTARAAELLRTTACSGPLIVLHRRNAMGFDRRTQRSISGDEWTRLRLARLGIDTARVETPNWERGHFGTHSEVQALVALARARSWHRLALISSPAHARRIRICLGAEDTRGMVVTVLASKDEFSSRQLAVELAKVVVYRLRFASRAKNTSHPR